MWGALIHNGAISAGHAAELVRIALDERLLDGWPGDRSAWAPMHAVRALGLPRADSSALPLLKLLGRRNDWLTDLLPEAWALMGPPVVPVLFRYTKDAGRNPRLRGLALYGLGLIVQKHPATRREVITYFTEILAKAGKDDREAMGCLVFVMGELKAVETWPAVEKAFELGKIDTDIYSKDDAHSQLAGKAVP